MRFSRRWRGCLLGLTCGLSACGARAERGHDELVVAAASDLAAAMPELARAFEAATGTGVVATLGSSGQLAQQIGHGAEVDVFASADAGWVAHLRAAGRIEPGSERIYARGRLVLRAGRGRDAPASVADLTDEGVRRVAIANPEHAPYGRAARQALEAAGIWQAIQPKLVIAENVRVALQYAAMGNVDVAITALSLVGESDQHWSLVQEDGHAPLDQVIAVVSGSQRAEQAMSFVRFVAGPQGREILARFGFVFPDERVAP